MAPKNNNTVIQCKVTKNNSTVIQCKVDFRRLIMLYSGVSVGSKFNFRTRVQSEMNFEPSTDFDETTSDSVVCDATRMSSSYYL